MLSSDNVHSFPSHTSIPLHDITRVGADTNVDLLGCLLPFLYARSAMAERTERAGTKPGFHI